MKSIFDTVSKDCSKIVTRTYSTSFSMATKMLANSIRQDIYNIYGFVRLADEIVDSFHDYPKEDLFAKLETAQMESINNLYKAQLESANKQECFCNCSGTFK